MNNLLSHFFFNLFTKKNLLIALIKKELKERYSNSALGLLWTVLQPLALIGVYTIVFTLVFRSTVPETYKQVPFVIFLMCGFIPFQIFSETVTRSTSILKENLSMVTKIVFPYELFPVAIISTSIITGFITFILTLVLMLFMGHTLSWNILYLPIFLIPLILLGVGMGWMVSCIAIVLRDITLIIPILLNLMFFGTPIFYSYTLMDKMGGDYPNLLFLAKLNPLYSIVVGFQSSLISDHWVLDTNVLIINYALTILIFLIGGIVFFRFKRELADLI